MLLDGATPVLVASHGGRLEVVRVLCGDGVEASQAIINGKTLLISTACWLSSHTQILMFLPSMKCVKYLNKTSRNTNSGVRYPPIAMGGGWNIDCLLNPIGLYRPGL